MWFQRCLYVFTFMVLVMVFPLANGENTRWTSRRTPAVCTVITVDPSGHGDFSTIQSAINSIPSWNSHWTCVIIKSGVYREKVTVPWDKPYIYLRGEGRRNTYVEWNDHATLAQSPTLTVLADNFKARGISFTEPEKERKENSQLTYNRKKELTKLRVKAEKAAEEKLGPELAIIAPIKY